MAVPDKIPIIREEDYDTHFIGRCEDGRQFMAFVTATVPAPPPEDWKTHKRWYAVLHQFDADGRHLRTEAWFAGTTADGERDVVKKAQAKREDMVRALGPVVFCDVEVHLFSVIVDGHTFGLIDVTEPGGDELVDLVPNDLEFYPPWTGEYDT
jgi:formate hydrogenlyase regulatory protein HycA